MRNLTRDMSRSDRVLQDYKDASLEDIKQAFDSADRSLKDKYAQAYMLKKYGEKVRDFAEKSSVYAEIYGLDKNQNPYIKFLEDVYNGHRMALRGFSGEKTASVLFKLVDDDNDVVTDDRFLKFMSTLNNKNDDIKAFYVQAMSWILDPQTMKKWRPDDPELNNLSSEIKKDSEGNPLSTISEKDAFDELISGKVDSKEALTERINVLATKTNEKEARDEPERASVRPLRGVPSDILDNFENLSDKEKEEFIRFLTRLNINPNQFLGYAWINNK